MTLPAKAQWEAASDTEMASLKKNNVYTLLPATSVPAGHKVIGSRWVYKVKADSSHKGRAVVLGWGQLPDNDCGSTFALVCKLQSIRMVLAISAKYNLECWQPDYITVFLNADVKQEVYVKTAPGYEQFDKNGVPQVMRFLKSLYGLHQSPNNWWNTIDTHLVEIGFKKSQVGTRASIHLLGVRRHLYPDPECRRRSLHRKRRPGARADQAEAHESFLNDGHGRRITRARDGCYP